MNFYTANQGDSRSPLRSPPINAGILLTLFLLGLALGNYCTADDKLLRCTYSQSSLSREVAKAGLAERFSLPQVEPDDLFTVGTKARAKSGSILSEPIFEGTRSLGLHNRPNDEIILSKPSYSPRFKPYKARDDEPRYDVLRGSFAKVGGGLEYRLQGYTRAFMDATRVLRNEERYSDEIRIGMRYAF